MQDPYTHHTNWVPFGVTLLVLAALALVAAIVYFTVPAHSLPSFMGHPKSPTTAAPTPSPATASPTPSSATSPTPSSATASPTPSSKAGHQTNAHRTKRGVFALVAAILLGAGGAGLIVYSRRSD